ncbi:MAG TPA: conjugal transfer protein TraD [Roseiarcus sp.]|nr:conjugal transfer protein TraD [Roseiarcus sp.]
MSATLAALGRSLAAHNRQQAAGARHVLRVWQVERCKRTRHLIELGGLVVKARVVDLTGDDRAVVLGALLWMEDKLKSNHGEQARAPWGRKGKGDIRFGTGDRCNHHLARNAAG